MASFFPLCRAHSAHYSPLGPHPRCSSPIFLYFSVLPYPTPFHPTALSLPPPQPPYIDIFIQYTRPRLPVIYRGLPNTPRNNHPLAPYGKGWERHLEADPRQHVRDPPSVLRSIAFLPSLNMRHLPWSFPLPLNQPPPIPSSLLFYFHPNHSHLLHIHHLV